MSENRQKTLKTEACCSLSQDAQKGYKNPYFSFKVHTLFPCRSLFQEFQKEHKIHTFAQNALTFYLPNIQTPFFWTLKPPTVLYHSKTHGFWRAWRKNVTAKAPQFHQKAGRFLDPKTGSAFWWNCGAFAATFLRHAPSLNIKFFAGLHFWYGLWFVAWLLSTTRQHMQLWKDASRTRPWEWFWNPFLGTGNNKILWSFNFCPSGAVHRWSMVATLGVRRLVLRASHSSPQIRFHFRLYFSKKIR